MATEILPFADEHLDAGAAHGQRFGSITTDWRSENLLSWRCWRNPGRRETYLRLYRAVP